MDYYYGSYFHGMKCIIADGNCRQDDGRVHVYRYRCRAEGIGPDGSFWKCGLQLQIWNLISTGAWQVYSRPGCTEDTAHQYHVRQPGSSNPKEHTA